MKKQFTSARLLIMTTKSLPQRFFGNWTSSEGHLLFIALLPSTTGRVQNNFQDSEILGQPEVTRFSGQGWQHENCLVVPPVVLLFKVLIFMFQCNTRGTLVVPYWPSKPPWPLLIHKFWNFVVSSYPLGPRRLSYTSCRQFVKESAPNPKIFFSL